jgi:hypothetical protein
MTTPHSTLHPTGDAVAYDASKVEYPLSNVVDTFGRVFATKVHGYGLNVLEIGSSGSVAFSPGDMHSLDLLLDPGQVKLRARDSNALVLLNEPGTASLLIADEGAAILTAGSNLLRMDATGNLYAAGGAGSNVFAAPAGSSHSFLVGETEVFRVDGSGARASNLVVDGSEFTVPRGPQSSRPSGQDGQIFYNEDAGRFEGFASSAWGGLGGVVDVDQDTYVSAETAPGANNNELRFYTAGEERMRINSAGKVGYGTSDPQYTLDIAGDVRISGHLLTNTTSQPKVVNLGDRGDGSTTIEDGVQNDGAGVRVAGLPNMALFASSKADRFEKSIRWNYNKNGVVDVGRKGAWNTESFWRMRGGSFRLAHTNPDSGAEVEYIMRINQNDELEFVRHFVPVNGDRERYEVVSMFGTTIGTSKLAPDRGYVSLDVSRTSRTVEQAADPIQPQSAGRWTPLDARPTVNAYVNSFSATGNYILYSALFPVGNGDITTSDVVAAAINHGHVSETFAGAIDNAATVALSSMFDGSPVPDTIVKYAGVVQLLETGEQSTSPVISFVLNDSVIEALADAAADATQAVMTYTLTFSNVSWSGMSAADAAVFEAWMESELLLAAKARNFGVISLDVSTSFGASSSETSVSVTFKTVDTARVMHGTVEGDATTVINPKSVIPFVDRPAETVSANSVAVVVESVQRVETAPTVVSLVQTASTGSQVDVEYVVNEANAAFSVAELRVLVATSPLSEPIVPQKIAYHPDALTVAVSGTSGTATIATDAARSYIYFVAVNNAPDPVISAEKVIVAFNSESTGLDLVTAAVSGSSGTDTVVVSGLDGIDDLDGVDVVVIKYNTQKVLEGAAQSATTNLVASHAVTGLADGTLYHLWVQVTDTKSIASSRYIGEVTTASLPSLGAVSVSATHNSITVSGLSSVTSTPGVQVTIDAVYGTGASVGDAANTTVADIGQAGAATRSIAGLAKDTAYNVWVIAKDASGNATEPLLLTATTANLDPPIGTQGVSVQSATGTTLVLQGLDGIQDPVDGVASVRVYHGTTNDIGSATVHEFAPQ